MVATVHCSLGTPTNDVLSGTLDLFCHQTITFFEFHSKPHTDSYTIPSDFFYGCCFDSCRVELRQSSVEFNEIHT